MGRALRIFRLLNLNRRAYISSIGQKWLVKYISLDTIVSQKLAAVEHTKQIFIIHEISLMIGAGVIILILFGLAIGEKLYHIGSFLKIKLDYND